MVWGVAALALFLAAKRREAVLLLLIMAVRLAGIGVKELVERPRPSPLLIDISEQATGFSFPSGHAMSVSIIYGFVFYLATVLVPHRVLRLIIQLACVYGIAHTAVYRVYTGSHWSSDMVGGFLFGGLAVAAFVWLHHRRFRPGRGSRDEARLKTVPDGHNR